MKKKIIYSKISKYLQNFLALEGYHLTCNSWTESCYPSSYWGRYLNFSAWFTRNIFSHKKKCHLVENRRYHMPCLKKKQ
jgi:hypothetical protein